VQADGTVGIVTAGPTVGRCPGKTAEWWKRVEVDLLR
jgi:hypothetical protein